LGGITIFPDTNSSGPFDTGDLSAVTASDGSWSINGLGTGHLGQKVLEITPTGDVETLGNAGYPIAGTSGTSQTGLNFADFVKFNISGTKFNDSNGDGSTAGDSGLGGVTIFLDTNSSGTFDTGDLSAVTASDGSW